ncbi:MAG: 4-hydroxy-tetrahydrodipicolinate synthase [Crocinitomicaceae bacterium]|jgi:4-hydroxy-tetrahydrodipicolinate synthase|nr:4-hydroxy-tetrahydrodipicolinate synthase [Crocinitomicaceae bacterium]
MKNIFSGAGTALVTPFNADFSIDFASLKKLVEFQLDGGIDFLVVQGTTGESPTLSWEEKMEILACVQEVTNKRVPIVFGLGGNNTVEIAHKLKTLPAGVDGLLSVSPYYNKPTQKGIVEHYKYVAGHTDLPIILYNVPGRTGSNMLAETTLELAEIDNIVAMKEASGNMEQIMDLIRLRPDGFGILSGDDPITMPLMTLGADGVISVVSNAFPQKFTQMVHLAREAKNKEAREIHYSLIEITKLFFAEGNPGGVKEALVELGLMNNTMRQPLYNVSSNLAERIKSLTKKLA